MPVELDKSDMFELADTLGIEIKRDPSRGFNQPLTGSADFKLRLMEGLNFPMQPKLVDSALYPTSAVMGAVVHLCGALYAVVLLDANKSSFMQDYLRLWLVNGARLNWKPKDLPPVFPVAWNRALFLSRIRDGVVSAYRRKSASVEWDPIEDPKAELASPPEQPPADTVEFASGGSVMSMADKFRTKGPRGW